MNSFKLLVVFILLLFGSFAQRFQRHLINGTRNGLININVEMDNLDALSSDGQNYVQNGGDIKFVGNVREGIELELENKELAFQFCSDGCMDKEVIACYDSINSDHLRQGDCDSGQCMFKAGIKEKDEKMLLWFKDDTYNKDFPKDGYICATATMKHPETTSNGVRPFPSCDPLKHDGNVVKLYIRQVPPGCPFYVLNAKKWTLPPPKTTTQSSSDLSKTNQTTSKSSEANTTMWIGIGAGIFILLIVLIGFGYCCYRTQIQKKPLFGKGKDVQQKADIPESPKKAQIAENEKTADEKEVLKPEKVHVKAERTKEATAAKEKPPKPTKKKNPEKRAPNVVPKPSKEITQENATKEDAPPQKKVSIEPTLEGPTIEASVVQKSVVQQKPQKSRNPPRVFVPKNVILPAPKSMNASKSKSRSGKKDSLSGRHEVGMQIMVQSPPENLKHHFYELLNNETKQKLEKFYPPGPVRVFDRREIEMLCCASISIMFKSIEMLIDVTIKTLTDRGVIFDKKCNIIQMSPKAEKHLQKDTTPEFVRAFAFGSVFREIIDSQANVHESFSIPLLFSIVLQRRYSVINRRKACTWIRRQLPIIQKEFSAKERLKMAFPICAIEAACKMNADGFKNVVLLDSLSGEDDDETQHSTTEKLGKK